MLGPARLAFVTAAATLLLVSGDAAAFCRTTTCDATTETCTKNDSGCVRDGVPVIWSNLPIVYRFYNGGSSKLTDDTAVRKAVKAAFKTWTQVQCKNGQTSVAFVNGPDITEDKPLKAKQASDNNGIYFRDDTWPHDDADESLALTNQIYGERTGTIDYADIEINTANTDFVVGDDESDGIDFQSVMTHEAGHYLGLAHSLNQDSIMVARYCASSDRCQSLETKRALSLDDENAVCALYPPAGTSDNTNTAPPASCAQSRNPGGSLAGVFGLVFLASAIVRRRLQRSA
jgi:hypothetical protein